jgi:hypothetical protein
MEIWTAFVEVRGREGGKGGEGEGEGGEKREVGRGIEKKIRTQVRPHR